MSITVVQPTPAPAPQANQPGRRRRLDAFEPTAAPRDDDSSPEAAMLRDALRAAELADQGAQGATGQAPPFQTPQGTTPPAVPSGGTGASPAQQPSGVPLQRFQQVQGQLRQTQDQAAYLDGLLRARGIDPANPQAAPAQPQPTGAPAAPNREDISARLAGQEALVIAAAERFDGGEISMAEYEKVRFKASTEIAALREQNVVAFVASQQPPAPPPQQISLADKQYLAQQAKDLEARHPWCKVLSSVDLGAIAKLVVQDHQLRGIPYPTGTEGQAWLNHEVAQWSDFIGPRWFPEVDIVKLTGAAPAQVQNNSPPAPARRGATPVAQPAVDRAALALALADQHPPNTSTIGAPGSATGDIADDTILSMTMDQIAALPHATQDRIFNRGVRQT